MSFDPPSLHFFFFNDTATTEIYTLSLHDALPISYVLFKSFRICWNCSSSRLTSCTVRPAPFAIRKSGGQPLGEGRKHKPTKLLSELPESKWGINALRG